MDAVIARVHAEFWAHLSSAGQMVARYDLIIAVTAILCRWAAAPPMPRNSGAARDSTSFIIDRHINPGAPWAPSLSI